MKKIIIFTFMILLLISCNGTSIENDNLSDNKKVVDWVDPNIKHNYIINKELWEK